VPLAVTQAGSAASACRVVRDKAAQTVRVMAGLPMAPRTQGAAGAQDIGPPAAPPPSRDRAAWSRGGSAAAYGAVRRQRSGRAARAARPAAADSARLRVLVCTKQTGAASNAAWQASSSETVTTWKPCTSWDPVGSA